VKVYICDTNNHCIRKVYYDVGEVVTPEIRGVPLCMDGECNPTDLEDDSLALKERGIVQRSPQKLGSKADEALNLECKNGQCEMPEDWADNF